MILFGFLWYFYFGHFYSIPVGLLDEFLRIITAVSIASFEIVISKSRNCVTVPLAKLS